MDYEQIRVRAKRHVDKLNLPRPLTVNTLHQSMEDLRGKRILISPAGPNMIEQGICGLWIEIAGEDFERIHYAPTSSAVHRQQFINHEFGHMILAHEKQLVAAERVALLAPLIPLDAIAYALARSSFTDEQELLAEAIGDQLAVTILRDSEVPDRSDLAGFGRIL